HLGTLHNLRDIAAFLANGETTTSSTSPLSPLTNGDEGLTDEKQIRNILLEVIAEKTGYTTKALELNMAMDADCIMPSINLVEILSPFDLPPPPTRRTSDLHLGTLHNLRDIAAFLANGETTTSSTSPLSPLTNGDEGLTDEKQIRNILLEVIAEKTG